MVTTPPLSILHVLAPADSGGLETVVRSLAIGQAATGMAVTVAAVLDTPRSPFVDEARDLGIRVEVVHSPARSVRPEREGVRALLKRERVNVLHSHGYRSDILDIGVARAMNVPSVTTLHGFSATDAKARVYEWLQIRAARRATAVVAVSANVRNRLLAAGVPPSRLHLISNAVPSQSVALDVTTARDRLELGHGLHVGWIGRLSAEKGPDVMLDAFQHLADLPVTLSFIGDGSGRASLEARAARAGVADRVRFHGRVADAATLLRAFDLVALSSRTEGTPMVLLEAMAAGIPIVATRVGGVPDMLSDQEAILVESENPQALAAAIRSSLTDPHASSERAARANARLQAKFSNEAWLARYEDIYRAIQPATTQAAP
jgi:glycosyltransferase involved in cell wall biosynthesis